MHWKSKNIYNGRRPITYPFQRRIDTAYLIHSVIRRPEISYLKTPLSKHCQLPQCIEKWQTIRGLLKCHSVILRNTTRFSLYFMFKSCASPTVYYAMAVIAITRLRFNTLWRFLHILKQLRYITLQRLCAKNKYSEEARCAQRTRYIQPMLV